MPTTFEICIPTPTPVLGEGDPHLVVLALLTPEPACVGCYRAHPPSHADAVNTEVLDVLRMIAEGGLDNGRCPCLPYL